MASKSLKEKIRSFPLHPGVYLMKDASGGVLYVGKAASLKTRVRSYFSHPHDSKTTTLLSQVHDIDYIECVSPEQALIVELALIKEKRPKYNIALRDDKSYPYVEITREKFPRIFISRPRGKKKSRFFGPYPNAGQLKAALSMIRKVFPYCSCRRYPKKPCLFSHLKLCPAPCTGMAAVSAYQGNIKSICRILNGERHSLMRELRKKMQSLAGKNRFEEASLIRDKLVAIETLYQGKPLAHEILSLQEALGLARVPLRIEAIDISSLSGKDATGSVVVFEEGMPRRQEYRKFRIKTVSQQDDYAMIKEVVRRRYSRLLREKQRYPDLLVIDGGLGHVQAAEAELEKLAVSLPLIGIAKRNEEVWFPQTGEFARKKTSPLVIAKSSPCLHLIQRLRDEAHRFAHSYHRLLRKKKLVGSCVPGREG
jgi:excinuclease ABC subunit C